MLGLLVLGLTAIMIYTLVKNALLGKQISKDDTFTGTVELIVPVSENSVFLLEDWQKSINASHLLPGQLKIHLLLDGVHPKLMAWQELLKSTPFIEAHSFPMRPSEVRPVTWMLEQISSKIGSQIVIIGDSELVPTEHVFLSISKAILEKNRNYFIVPQTAKTTLLGETIAVLNPTLAFTSFFGFKKWRRNFTHPLLKISQGWMAMRLETFKELDFKTGKNFGWKEHVSRQWDEQKKNYHLAFGEKHLIRYYPQDLKTHVLKLRNEWEVLAQSKDKVGFALYVVALFLWSFPVVCLMTHPFWAIASFFLLILYRFFSKIVFQESWTSIILHLLGCVVWLGTLIWYLVDLASANFKTKQLKG